MDHEELLQAKYNRFFQSGRGRDENMILDCWGKFLYFFRSIPQRILISEIVCDKTRVAVST